METHDSLDFAQYVYRERPYPYEYMTNEQLEKRCPLDNGRHDCTPISTGFATGHLDRLPVELIIEILLQLDIPSLTRFRRLNRRAMQLVNSIHQYAAIIEHCPNIIRAILSVHANAFDCATLYRTLCTTRCLTCNRFGDYLYLILCCRVCYLCFTTRPEYSTIEYEDARELLIDNSGLQYDLDILAKLFWLAKIPNILSLPGRHHPQRRLYDRPTVVQVIQGLVGNGLIWEDYTTGKEQYMAIITAPVLLNGGRQVDYGFFCRGCKIERDEKTMHYMIKYTTEEIPGHIARYGQIVERGSTPGTFVHVKSALYKEPVP